MQQHAGTSSLGLPSRFLHGFVRSDRFISLQEFADIYLTLMLHRPITGAAGGADVSKGRCSYSVPAEAQILDNTPITMTPSCGRFLSSHCSFCAVSLAQDVSVTRCKPMSFFLALISSVVYYRWTHTRISNKLTDRGRQFSHRLLLKGTTVLTSQLHLSVTCDLWSFFKSFCTEQQLQLNSAFTAEWT